MRRKLFSLALGLLLPGFAMAQTFEALNFKLVNGETRSFAFLEKPVITFVDDYIRVTTATESVMFVRSEVDSYSFKSDSEGINSPELSGLLVSRVSNDLLRVEGAPADCVISVWTVGGAACLTLRCNDGGSADVDLTNLVAGAYVVRIGECQTLKIVKQ